MLSYTPSTTDPAPRARPHQRLAGLAARPPWARVVTSRPAERRRGADIAESALTPAAGGRA